MRKIIFQNIILMSFYFLFGKASLLISVPPGFSTPIWPSAGIAAAGLVFWGRGVWGGVFFGSFLLNLSLMNIVSYEQFNSDKVLIAFFIALGASLQAIITHQLVFKITKLENIFKDEKDIIKIVLIAGPVSTLVGASNGIMVLSFFDIINSSNIIYNWVNWWVGDTIGVVTVFPIISILFHERFNFKRSFFSIFAILSGLTITILCFYFLKKAEFINDELVFRNKSLQIQEAIYDKLNDYSLSLHNLKGFFIASKTVTLSSFNTFVENQVRFRKGIKGLSWVPKILHEDREDFEYELKKKFSWTAGITKYGENNKLILSSNEDVYYPVFYLYPLTGNESAIGFNLNSEKKRRNSLLKSFQTNQMSSTAKINLVQDKKLMPAVLLSLPYFNEFDNKLSSGNENLVGYFTGIFIIQEMVNEIPKSLRSLNIGFNIYDISMKDNVEGLYIEDSLAKVELKTSLKFLDRIWSIEFFKKAEYTTNISNSIKMIVLVSGILFTGLLGILILIFQSKNRLLNLKLHQSERLAAVGELAAGVGHEINNPLTIISGNIQLINIELKQDHVDIKKVKEKFNRLEIATKRIANIVAGLRTFSKDVESNTVFDIVMATKSTIDLVKGVYLHDNIKIDFSSSFVDLFICANHGRIQQVIMNLLSNSKHALENCSKKLIRIIIEKIDDNVVITIADNGKGIPYDIQDKVFNAFYSTKPLGEGTGLGLSLATSIIYEHNGKLSFSSRPGETVFKVTIPINLSN